MHIQDDGRSHVDARLSRNKYMPYIDPAHELHLKQFKYKGGSYSLTYEYLWSPFSQYLLRFFPLWIAPNLITFSAFLLVLLSYFLFVVIGEDGPGDPLPPWKCVLFAVTMFIYQHLDNIDGKQARRTKSSSPVGMLFDHGADALTGIIFALQIARLLCIPSEEETYYIVFLFIMLPNFIGLLVQYSTGELKLGRINPIDEGIPSYILLSLSGCYFDLSFWKQQHWFGAYYQQFSVVMGVVFVVILYFMSREIFVKSERTRQDVMKQLLLIPIALLFFICVTISGLQQQIYGGHFHLVTGIWLGFWGRNMMLLQVSYVTKQEFHCFNRANIFFIMGSLPLLMGRAIPLAGYLAVFAVGQLCLLGQFIISFLGQATAVLGIEVFRITRKIDHDR